MPPVPSTMRAWRYSDASAGLQKSMRLVEEPLPKALTQLNPDHELIKVHAMSLNPGDYKVAERQVLLGRIMAWALIRRPATPGLDFAGTIATGPREGTRVFGTLGWLYQNGTLAEYTQAMRSVLAEIPEGVGFGEAAALGTGVLTAYNSLVPFVRGKDAGQRVFINGGSGGVGVFAIQIAKILGCYTVVSCSTRNVELCKSLGADEILDYMTLEGRNVGTELSRRVKQGTTDRFDLVIDNVGHDVNLHRKSEGFVKDDGHFLLIAAMDEDFSGVWSMFQSWLQPRWLGGTKVRWSFTITYQNEAIIEEIRGWVAKAKLKIIVDEEFSFNDAPKAVAKLKTGKATGKVVISGMHR